MLMIRWLFLVIILEKKPFDTNEDSVAKWFEESTELDVNIQNDIYTTFDAEVPSSLNKIKVNHLSNNQK